MYPVVGVLLALFSCISESCGLCVWRMASMAYFGAPNNAIRATLLGLVFQALSMLLNLGALSLMAESSTTIVNSVSVVTIILMSWLLLGEKPAAHSVIGAIVVFLGMLLCVLSKRGPAVVLGFDATMRYLGRAQDIVWLSLLFSISIGLFFTASWCSRPLLYPLGAGFMGGLTETLAKIMANSIAHVTVTAVLLATLAVTVSLELYFIKTSLVYLQPAMHTLTFFVSWSLTGILSGGIMFDEFDAYGDRPLDIAMLVIGILSIIAGASIPALCGPPRRNSRVFRSSRHKAVPKIISALIRPPLTHVRTYQRPKYRYGSEGEEISSDDEFRGPGVIEMQRLTQVGASDCRLDQGTGDPYCGHGPEEEPAGILSQYTDEE